MQKKRVTRLSTNDKKSSLNEFKYQQKQIEKQQRLEKPQRKSKSKNFTLTKPKQIRFSNQQFNVQKPKTTQNQNLNQSIEKGIKQIKKKKVSKKEQNQAIRILQQRQNQKIFQHLCNPDGLITVESLGRIMVRAKKDFEIEDLQNMISYYDTIKKKLQNQNESTQNQGNKTKKINRNKKYNVQKIQLISQMEEDQDSQQNFEDQLDQSDNEQQIEVEEEEEKSELIFEEFKILKNYFEK